MRLTEDRFNESTVMSFTALGLGGRDDTFFDIVNSGSGSCVFPIIWKGPHAHSGRTGHWESAICPAGH